MSMNIDNSEYVNYPWSALEMGNLFSKSFFARFAKLKD